MSRDLLLVSIYYGWKQITYDRTRKQRGLQLSFSIARASLPLFLHSLDTTPPLLFTCDLRPTFSLAQDIRTAPSPLVVYCKKAAAPNFSKPVPRDMIFLMTTSLGTLTRIIGTVKILSSALLAKNCVLRAPNSSTTASNLKITWKCPASAPWAQWPSLLNAVQVCNFAHLISITYTHGNT